MNNSMKMGLVKVTLFSILLALSGMAAIASADFVTPIRFQGNVSYNGEWAQPGTVINAYIDDKPSGTYTVTEGRSGVYYIDVRGTESDEGELITFEICGATADQTDTWHASADAETRPLDLTAVDNVAPAVTNATATPQEIFANGVETTQLNVTVIDGCRCTVGDVTVNLSAIGGSGAQVMTCIVGTDVYSVTANSTAGTAPGAYCLQVNASDRFGDYNDSVCINLVIKGVAAPGAPVVSNPDANPTSIVADGAETSQLNVTVVDDSDTVFVTVNLSAIGGSAVQEMARVGTTDVYSVITNATEDTPADTYCLQVNASDVDGNYNDSVCIELEVTTPGLPKTGDIDEDGDVDLFDAIHLAKYATGAGSDKFRTIHADGDIDDDGDVDLFDAIHLAKYATGAGSDKFRTIYS